MQWIRQDLIREKLIRGRILDHNVFNLITRREATNNRGLQ